MESRLTRIPTDVPGLDTIMAGGLVSGSVFIVQGAPGTGKTVLGNQIAFNHVRRGGRALYMTLLGESHGRLILYLSNLAFFDRDVIARSLFYVSGYHTILHEGSDALLRLIAAEARERDISLLVLDGLSAISEITSSETDLRQFINALGHQAELQACTTVVLSTSSRPPTSPEYAMVDGWLTLSMRYPQGRALRHLQLNKLRGSDLIAGQHAMCLSDAGMTVYPRLETVEGLHPDTGTNREGVMDTGIDGLNRMLNGGLPRSSVTLLTGPAGGGKTSIGLQLLSRCTPDRPGLLFGFYEPRDRLARKAEDLGINLDGLLRGGALHIVWHPATEHVLDALAHELLHHVRRLGIDRLFLDGIGAFQQASPHACRLDGLLAALANALREANCTTVIAMESAPLFTGPRMMGLRNASAIAENIITLRYVQREATFRRGIRLNKVRERQFDPALKELFITQRGLQIGRTFSLPEPCCDCNPDGMPP